jgi:hypothetical protein
MDFEIRIAGHQDEPYALLLSQMYTASAAQRKTGIATRSPEYILGKINGGDAIIALTGKTLAGFCYIETFTSGKYVSNSGLIVGMDFRGMGLARKIKDKVLNLAREKYPDAQVFGITTSPVVMNINIGLGYRPVPFSKLTEDEQFWNGCKTCVNFDVLTRNERQLCLCTGMIAPSGNELIKQENEKNEQDSIGL